MASNATFTYNPPPTVRRGDKIEMKYRWKDGSVHIPSTDGRWIVFLLEFYQPSGLSTQYVNTPRWMGENPIFSVDGGLYVNVA